MGFWGGTFFFALLGGGLAAGVVFGSKPANQGCALVAGGRGGMAGGWVG